jgi:DNA-binding MarR family transcriptional regulator
MSAGEETFPDDVLRQFLQRLARQGLLEPHNHAGFEVSLSEVMALGELVDVGGLSQQQLGDLLGLEKSTVSRLSAGMEGRGWLVRERDPANRRYYRLRLTDEGRDVAVQIGADLRGHHRRLLAAMTPEERDGLSLGLSGLLRALDEVAHTGADAGQGTPGMTTRDDATDAAPARPGAASGR